jgi:hypothetical protein
MENARYAPAPWSGRASNDRLVFRCCSGQMKQLGAENCALMSRSGSQRMHKLDH